MNELWIDHGGLMRCCLHSLKYQHEEGLLNGMDGTRCEHCGCRIERHEDGYWRWVRE